MQDSSPLRNLSKAYICDDLCLAVLYVIEQLALFQLIDSLLPVIPLLFQTCDVVFQAEVNVLDVLGKLVTMAPICTA